MDLVGFVETGPVHYNCSSSLVQTWGSFIVLPGKAALLSGPYMLPLY